MTLAANQFSAFFRAVHGTDPFPWQERMLHQVLESGWVNVVSLPTASGKTAVLDVAVFALACQAGLPPQQRRAPRRMVLVVDRRIVVDDAHRRAVKIRDALRGSDNPVVREAAAALLSLGGDTALEVAALRGGIYREDRWARTPLQPVILCSTVDQVGSRLLHRGYGVSPRMRPVHAGLLSHDTLLVLDEAHCSHPFLSTLRAVGRLRGVAQRPVPAPWAVVAMTATPRDGDEPFALDAPDLEHPALKRRLQAKKSATLEVCGAPKDAGLVEACVKHLRTLCEPGRTVLVVLNRVGAARALRDKLKTLAAARRAGLAADSVLLTGRCRPVERDALLEQWRHRVMAGRDRAASATQRPLVVVATQCVEVGADLDADALVTEACPLDSLRQRLGRLDRLGELGESRAVVLCRPESVGTADNPVDDPVYGAALAGTWEWLKELASGGTLDLGTAALDRGLPEDRDERLELLGRLSAPAPDAPVTFPAYCDLWVQTQPEPSVSPDPAVFLHGPQRGEPEVRLLWRADLPETEPATWIDTVAACPPVAGESMPIPISQARRFLAGEIPPDHGDVESAPPAGNDDENTAEPAAATPFVRWAGLEASVLATDPRALRPGDVVVLPCSRGGCDAEGWNPAATTTPDCADRARWLAQRAAVLRLHPGLKDAWGTAWPAVAPLAALAADAMPDDVAEQVAAALAAVTPAQLPDGLRHAVETLRRDGHRAVEPHPSGTGVVVSSHRRLAADARDFTDEDNTSSAAAGPVPLPEHLDDVAAWAGRIGQVLPADLREDVVLAARLHDLGKSDPRFQAYLADGNPVLALRQGLLAKSGRVPASPARDAAARRRAGYPKGARHELLSVRLAESHPAALAGAHDPELVLHLVASHHGHCRPLAPVVDDTRPLRVSVDRDGGALSASTATGLERVDSGVAERFWNLVRRYGWWGLSYLEACLRLADHRASEAPGKGDCA